MIFHGEYPHYQYLNVNYYRNKTHFLQHINQSTQWDPDKER